MPSPSQPGASNKVCWLISFAFHAIIIGVLVVFAAHEGLLGKQLKKIAVEFVHEKPPDKPKEPEKPKEEPPKVEQPHVAQAPRLEPPKEAARVIAPPPIVAVAPAVAPPPAEVPAFDFGGGKTVQSSSDPIALYRGYVESSLRSKWTRPAGITDDDFVAEVEVSVNAAGEILNPEWRRNSGNARWDASVRAALDAARNLERRPPANFPSRVLVRFDVQDVTEPVLTP